MCLQMDDLIKVGEYIVIQRQNFKKLHKYNKTNSCVSLGRDSVNLSVIEGCPYNSVFRMVAGSLKKNKEFNLELVQAAIGLRDEIDVKSSGTDNRNILDDGQSQKLTTVDIEELKCEGSKASDIVESLISNSNTFYNRTEFSQDKYLRKKEKKYFEYIQIMKPNLRIISEVMYRLDPSKIQNIRIDTLSQILTMSNISSEGCHLLYDSGSNGLMAAALLSAIGPQTNGKLVHMHPGNMSQKQALLAMNFNEEQFNRCISVNVYSVLRQVLQGCDTNIKDNIPKSGTNNCNGSLKRKTEESSEHDPKKIKLDDPNINDAAVNEQEQSKEPKKPKWHFDNLAAADLLVKKVDSLVIVCKEDPKNLFEELIAYVKPGRPFVIYYNVAEPLQNLYLSLKSNSNTAALRLTSNWLRDYQILPERTHPEVLMNGSSGFLLTGYVLK